MPQREIVPAAPATASRYGLLVAAPQAGTVDRPGIKWEPEACTPGASGAVGCEPLDRSAEVTSPGVHVASPILLWAVERCSALGFRGRDWQGRARRALDASKSHQLAAELWTGTITKDQFADEEERTGFLADDHTTIIDGAALAPQAALSVVEAEASMCSEGQRLFLHMPVWMIEPIITASAYVARDGNLLTTALGNIIVADSGYPGTKPDAADDDSNTWIYATKIVQTFMGEVETLPKSLDDAKSLAEAVHWAKNDAFVWAQRLATYQLDPCCRFAVQTNVPLVTLP